ncbi:MAG: hypothetical protein MR266_03575 [Erysipelotrichaceae bacterium]|nr:hypothetical protein [Erysipelotrichaceae bacterium]
MIVKVFKEQFPSLLICSKLTVIPLKAVLELLQIRLSTNLVLIVLSSLLSVPGLFSAFCLLSFTVPSKLIVFVANKTHNTVKIIIITISKAITPL